MKIKDIFKKQLKNEPQQTKPESNPGLTVSAGIIQASEFDVTDRNELYKYYEEMRKSDCVSSTSLDMLKYPIEQAEYRIIANNTSEIAEESKKYIEWCFKQLDFMNFQRHALLSLDYGASFFEKLYKNAVTYYDTKGKKRITNIISRLVPFQVWTIERFEFDSEFNLDYIVQYASDNTGFTRDQEIKAKKLFYVTNREEYNDIRGNSLFRPAIRSYRIKKVVFESAARGITRSSGIPELICREDQFSKARTIGRTLGNSEYAYLVHTEDIKINMLDVKGGLDKANELLDYCDRQMFFNTLTEFISSGIGGNGSRAATSEHKTAYELAANGVLKALERKINELIVEMISMSYLANIDIDDIPRFEYQAINKTDIFKAAASINNFYDKGVFVKQEGDEDFLRSMFDMPETKKIDNNPLTVDEIEKTPEITMKHDCNCHELSNTELIERLKGKRRIDQELKTQLDKKMLSYDPQKKFLDIQTEAESIILDIKARILKDFAGQLKRNKNAKLTIAYKPELKKKLVKLYESASDDGFKQLVDELGKATNKIEAKRIELQKSQLIATLDLTIDAFTDALKRSVEIKRNQLKDKVLEKYESWEEFTGSFIDEQKGLQRDLITETQSGWFDGRSDAIIESGHNLWVYTAIMDDKVCDVCVPFDGLVYTMQEILDDPDLNIEGHPTNINCLGGDKCRCTFVALFEEKENINQKLPQGVLKR